MAKKTGKSTPVKKETRKVKREKERSQISNNQLTDELQENNELDNDFFVDDADEVDYNQLDNEEIEDDQHSEDLDGSDLDYDEDDHLESEHSGEEEDTVEDSKGKKGKKPFSITKEKFKKLKEKALSGNSFAISQCIVVFSKAINLGNTENELENMEVESKENIINSKSQCMKIIKFSLKDLFEILQVKVSKPLIKRLLGVIYKFLKNGEAWDPSIISLAFSQLFTNVKLVKMFKTYTEVFIKLAVKFWLSLEFEGSAVCLSFLREIAQSGEFDFVLKSCYLGYISIAKAMNKHSFEKIQLLMDNIIYILKSSDSETGYKNVFLFLRKISIELNRTIQDKKWSSIKNIYNWQVINSLFLWFRVMKECYSGVLESDYKLLAYPLIQITIGVVRLHLVSNFFPLRILLLEQLIDLSKNSGTMIPIGAYILEILESNVFSKYYRNKTDPKTLNKQRENLLLNQGKGLSTSEKKKQKRKLEKLRLKAEDNKHKHSLAKKEGEFYIEDLSITLKIRDFNSYETSLNILKASCGLLVKYLDLFSHKISFCEVAWPIVYSLKRILKNITEKEFKEAVKEVVDLAENNISFIAEKREKIKVKEVKLSQVNTIGKIESAIKKKYAEEIPIKKFNLKEKKKLKAKKEAKKAKKEGKFIEI